MAPRERPVQKLMLPEREGAWLLSLGIEIDGQTLDLAPRCPLGLRPAEAGTPARSRSAASRLARAAGAALCEGTLFLHLVDLPRAKPFEKRQRRMPVELRIELPDHVVHGPETTRRERGRPGRPRQSAT